GHFQNQSSKLVATKGKEVNMAVGDSDDALVCCIENTVEDRIMDSGASFHATYCKEELERFKLRSGKVCLEDDKTLDIADVGDVVLKTSFGTSWTLKDVRYIPGLKRRLISIGQLDEEGYHVGFRDQQWKVTKCSLVVARGNKCESMYMVEVHPERIDAFIDGSGSAALWFGEAEKSFLHNVSEDKETEETVTGVAVVPETPLQFGVAERLSRTFRAESTRIRGGNDEGRKDTSLTHLKVFGCDSFVKVKDICGEAIKCTFIGSGSDEMRYNFWDTKSHQVIRSRDITFVDSIYRVSLGGSSDTSEGSKIVGASRIVEDQMKNTLKTKHPTRREASRLHKYEDPPESPWLKISAGKKASQSLWMFMVKEEQDGSKRYKARLMVKGFCHKRWVDYNEIFSLVVKMTTISDVYQVGDEREVEVLRSFNWPLSELITDDGLLLERGYSQFNDISSGYLDTLYRKSSSPAFGWCSMFRMFSGAIYRTEMCAGVIYPNTCERQEESSSPCVKGLEWMSRVGKHRSSKMMRYLKSSKSVHTNHVPKPSLSHPPLVLTRLTAENRVENLTETGAPKVFNAQVMNSSQDIPVDSNKTFSGQNVVKSGGSVLDVMEGYLRVILFDCWIGDVPLRGNFISCSHGPEQKKPSGAVKHSAPIDLSFRRLDGSNTSIKVNIFGWQLGKIVYRTRVTDSQRPPLLSRYLSEFMGGALDPHEWSSVQSGSLRFFQFQFSLRSKYVGGVVFVSWWFIWNFRNQIIFEESSPDVRKFMTI
ncbi:retrovirus-related pol polyprotein from transposon TNT 1-94, partial [Tanacetum coccineum]